MAIGKITVIRAIARTRHAISTKTDVGVLIEYLFYFFFILNQIISAFFFFFFFAPYRFYESSYFLPLLAPFRHNDALESLLKLEAITSDFLYLFWKSQKRTPTRR